MRASARVLVRRQRQSNVPVSYAADVLKHLRGFD